MERYRFFADAHVCYVTFSVVDWLPVFVSEAACRIVTDSLTYCHRQKWLRINAFVIMPTHFHAIFFDQRFDPAALEKTLTDFRKFTGRQLSDFCAAHMPACFSDTLRARSGDDRARRFWRPTRHPVVIETEAFWQTKLDYLHENPCRKGLVLRAEHWRFSSAAFWLSEGTAPTEVPLTALQW